MDFTVVDTHNPLTLGIADTSFYPTGFSIVNPTYEITPPAFLKATIAFTASTLEFFNSNNLNITCVDDVSLLASLPDGVWTVRQSISPAIDHNAEKTFMRTTQIEQKLGRAFLRTDITQCNLDMRIEQMKVIDEISFYIQAAIAAANQCNALLAMDLYRLANKMLDNFLQGRCRGVHPTLLC